MKATKRAQYKRSWAAAARTLRNAHCDDTASEDESTELLEFPFNSTPGPANSSTESEQDMSELSPKRVQTDSEANCSSAQSVDVDEIVPDPYWSSDSEDDKINDNFLAEGLGNWANKFFIKHNALDGLLVLLKENGHPNLPVTARTLLQTERNVTIQKKSGMEYVYFPLASQLLKHFKKYPADIVRETNSLEISLNVDGLPLFKSSGMSLWPVLCAIVSMKPVVVFPVVLTCGNSKPKDLEFLEDLVRDLGDVLENGLKDDGRVIEVTLRCIVCDAPARALVKGTRLCSGYFGCDKCAQKGLWVGRVTYPLVKGIELRTDLSFREQDNEGHHHGTSPFCNIQVDMIKKFPIDYMHQLCLGVMRKLILTWMRGKREVKISAGQVETISAKLLDLKSCIPNTFARKPRSLADVDRWKATEFRQFLLYTGKIVLNGILRPDQFEHFLCLSVASCILVCPMLAQSHRDYAKQMMEYFVEQGKILYGDEFLVYNVHSMVHLADEVKEFGSLDACSSFPFENYMQKLKRLVRSGKNPIAQVAKRMSECSGAIEPPHEVKISLTKPDNAFILTDLTCCEVVDKVGNPDQNGNELYLCRVYERTDTLFSSPCDSRLIGVHKATVRWTTMKVLPSHQLKRKAIKIDLGHEKTVFMAVLHTNS